LAHETGQVEAIGADLAAVAQVVAETPDFMNVMRQPRLPAQQKKGILLSVFGGSASTLVLDFLCLLIDKKRVTLTLTIAEEFQAQVNEWRHLMIAAVTTAIPLTDEEELMFSKRLREITGKQIELITRVDPSLIAGVRVVVGGKMIDATVATHLERVRERFKRVRVV